MQNCASGGFSVPQREQRTLDGSVTDPILSESPEAGDGERAGEGRGQDAGGWGKTSSIATITRFRKASIWRSTRSC